MKRLKHIYSFKDFPIYMRSTENNFSKDIKKDMNWYVQNRRYYSIKSPYTRKNFSRKSHNSGVVGKMWMEHHEKFTNFIIQNNVSNVLEMELGMVFYLKKY